MTVIIIWSKRSKFLPFPKEIPAELYEKYGIKIRENVQALKKESVFGLDFSPGASAYWEEIYPELSRDRYGPIGAILNRSEAQVIRIALIYAILDRSTWIDLPHLEAALAVWDYVEQSTAKIFKAVTSASDTPERKIRTALRDSKQIVRSEVHSLVGNNLSKIDLDNIKNKLVQEKFMQVHQQKNITGRPSEVWALC